MTSPDILTVDSLVTQIYETEEKLAIAAAKIGESYLQEVLKNQKEATISARGSV